MSIDPRAALDRLFAAFEAHHDAVAAAQDEDAPVVISAARTLADSFDTYDDALLTTYGVDTPFDVYDEDDDYDDDDDGDYDSDDDEDYDSDDDDDSDGDDDEDDDYDDDDEDYDDEN